MKPHARSWGPRNVGEERSVWLRSITFGNVLIHTAPHSINDSDRPTPSEALVTDASLGIKCLVKAVRAATNQSVTLPTVMTIDLHLERNSVGGWEQYCAAHAYIRHRFVSIHTWIVLMLARLSVLYVIHSVLHSTNPNTKTKAQLSFSYDASERSGAIARCSVMTRSQPAAGRVRRPRALRPRSPGACDGIGR